MQTTKLLNENFFFDRSSALDMDGLLHELSWPRVVINSIFGTHTNFRYIYVCLSVCMPLCACLFPIFLLVSLLIWIVSTFILQIVFLLSLLSHLQLFFLLLLFTFSRILSSCLSSSNICDCYCLILLMIFL